jgi:putative transposase
MVRIARTVLPDGTFHVTSRGVARAEIFRDENDYAFFRNFMLQTARKFAWTVHAYCLMPNHYHVILDAARTDLSKGMQRLNGVYAQTFNDRHRRVGHLFQGRFSSYVIESEEHYERALAYVFDNPVAAGLCAEEGEWPWRDVSRV